MPVNGASAVALGAGVLFLVSGLRGWAVSTTIGDLLTGKNPASQPGVNLLSTQLSAAGVNEGSTGLAPLSGLASYAEQYQGGPYGWGKSGPPGTPVDCSGLPNYALGKHFGRPIPGYPNGKYSGHGPVTGQYYVWSGASTISPDQMEAGDLVCFLTHMGIAVSNTQMISALNSTLGVQVTTVSGGAPAGELGIVRIRRLQ